MQDGAEGRDGGRCVEAGGGLAASCVHFGVGVVFEGGGGEEGSAGGGEWEASFGAAVVALGPVGLDEVLEVGGVLSEGVAEVDAGVGVEAEEPAAVCGEA